jgi:hypothetical protein
MSEKRNECKVVIADARNHEPEMYASFYRGKLNGNRPLGRIRRRWVYSIKIGLKYIAWYCMDWIHLAYLANIWMWSTFLVINWMQCAKRNL